MSFTLRLCAVFALAVSPVAFAAETVIADFDATSPAFKTKDATAEVIPHGDGKGLRVTLGKDEDWPNVQFNGMWDLSRHTHILADITNVSDETIRVVSKVLYKGGTQKGVGDRTEVDPGETATMRIPLNRPAPVGYEYLGSLEGMDVNPLGNKEGAVTDPSRINMIQFFGLKPARPQTFVLDNVRAVGAYRPPTGLLSEAEFFPFIDKFGQYKHQDWPTKVHGDAEFAQHTQDEQRDLAEHPAPADRTELGGWAEGPTVDTDGKWGTVKRDGKWWLVTPEGKLFWSLGVDVVQPGQSTRIAPGRENWFEDLPKDDPAYATLFEVKKNERGKNVGLEQTVFDFYGANMIRKFGDGWQDQFANLAHQRLRSWGFNTIGLWAKGPVIQDPPMPYTHWAFYMSQRIKVWGPALPKWFPDVYDPSFKKGINQYSQRMLKGHSDNPMLIGLFVDNELPWGGETTMGELAILAPPDSPHAAAFEKMLTEKYGDIAQLNRAWGTDYADWEAFGESKDVPTGDAVTQDLLAFSEQTMRIYFETCREAVRTHAPGKLYLGCRFAEHYVNPLVTRIAAEYCDVVSFNVYRDSVSQWRPPAEIDKPVLIGEFHFGAPDRGVFGRGLVGVESQEERAEAIERYVGGAAQNPLIVGAHWFQYVDEMTTGRPLDKENHQVGLVSVADVPHVETIQAFRNVGARLYQLRSEAPATTQAAGTQAREPD